MLRTSALALTPMAPDLLADVVAGAVVEVEVVAVLPELLAPEAVLPLALALTPELTPALTPALTLALALALVEVAVVDAALACLFWGFAGPFFAQNST